ncbi:MAG: alkaline phosphatase PafA [Salibacteraceae bacterium]
MKKLLFVMLCFFLGNCSTPVNTRKKNSPKLVVGVVVDQMRYDYLTRFEEKYGENGFKRLIKEGYHCKEHHFSYMPTYTGPGHASVFTGTTPKTHGIIANDWYDRDLKRYVYCAEDTTVKSVGGDFSKENRSPQNMLVTSIADQIKLHTQKRGKSIGISIKDRGAILPAGKMADAAYWFVGGKEGKFISSTYYMNELPTWVKKFNNQKYPDKYMKQNWETLYPIKTYTESGPDNNPHEESLKKNGEPVFPYDLGEVFEDIGYHVMKETPYGNDLLVDFAKETIVKEQLGSDEITDFLSVSFSSTDYIGHSYGPQSVEIEDTYLRLDKTLAQFLEFLDNQIGEGNYTVFLTADHGVAQIPSNLMENGVEVGYYNSKEMKKSVDSLLALEYNMNGLIENFSNYQFFMDYHKVDSLGLNRKEIAQKILSLSLQLPGVKSGITAESLREFDYLEGVEQKVQNGWNIQKSGDVAIIMEPGWLSSKYKENGGTGHGSPWSYDTHVPLLFFGFGIENGESILPTSVEDIVPTIAHVVGVQAPMGCSGKPISVVSSY